MGCSQHVYHLPTGFLWISHPNSLVIGDKSLIHSEFCSSPAKIYGKNLFLVAHPTDRFCGLQPWLFSWDKWGQVVHSKSWGELTHQHDSWDEPPSMVNLLVLSPSSHSLLAKDFSRGTEGQGHEFTAELPRRGAAVATGGVFLTPAKICCGWSLR